MARLRRVVDPFRNLIETRPSGYVLHADTDSCDALRFEHLISEATSARRGSGDPVAAALLREALGLWRGSAYGDLHELSALRGEVTRLEELRLSAVEERADVELALGGAAQVVLWLEALVREHPLRERLRGLLAEALYRAGRQADALAVLAAARVALREELGVDPGPELRRIEHAVLTQDSALDPLLPAPPRAAELPAPLRADTTPLVGREADLGWLRRRWSEAARSGGGVAVVRGPSGSGRSRLVAELAREVHARGARVVYARGSVGHELGSVAPGEAEVVPTLVVLHDLHLCTTASPLCRRPPWPTALARG